MNKESEKPEENEAVESAEEEEAGLERHPQTAKRFFERAAEVAATGASGYDYAIDLYCDGLAWDPEALKEGHQSLHEVSLRRKAAGGKKPGLMDRKRLLKARSPKDKMIANEFMLAKDPENVKYLEGVLSNALKIGANVTARWLARLLVEHNRASSKPSLDRFLLATDAFDQVEDFQQAVIACEEAMRLRPNDQALITRMKNLSAQATMKAGRYNEAESFRDSVKDIEGQAEDQERMRLVQKDESIRREIERTGVEYEAEPNVPGKIFAYVDALQRLNTDAEATKALEVLDQAYARARSYRFKERAGDIRMRQLRQRARGLAERLQADPKNEQLLAEARELAKRLRELEEGEYAERVANYPTDMGLKFEYGRRLYANGKYDQAIPVLQQAENDPKNRLRAKSLLGQSFIRLKFFNEAVDTFRRAIDDLEVTGNEISKELYYHMGLALEEMGKTAEADAAYSQVMQWEFNFRDVRARLQKLRSQAEAAGAES